MGVSSLPLDAEELARQGLELTHFTEENKTTLRTTWHILYSKVGPLGSGLQGQGAI